MKKITLIFSVLFLILLVVSCEGVLSPSNNPQSLELDPYLFKELEEDLNALYSNYDTLLTLKGTYDEQSFRENTGYIISVYPELGTFDDFSSVNELSYGITDFKTGDKVKIRLGNSAYLIDKAFVISGDTNEFLNGPAPVVALEFLCGDPIVKVNGMPYQLEYFPETTENKIQKATWSGSGTMTDEEDIYILRGISKDENNHIDFELESDAKYFITKVEFYKDWKTVDTIYSFEKPNNDGTLSFYPFQDAEGSDIDSLLYYISMLGNDGKYYTKRVLVRFNYSS